MPLSQGVCLFGTVYIHLLVENTHQANIENPSESDPKDSSYYIKLAQWNPTQRYPSQLRHWQSRSSMEIHLDQYFPYVYSQLPQVKGHINAALQCWAHLALAWVPAQPAMQWLISRGGPLIATNRNKNRKNSHNPVVQKPLPQIKITDLGPWQQDCCRDTQLGSKARRPSTRLVPELPSWTLPTTSLPRNRTLCLMKTLLPLLPERSHCREDPS